MLPDMNGYEVLKNLRAAKVNTPVLILSGLSEPDKKVKGLGFGADDYLTKPFDKAELLARLQAVVRRSKGIPIRLSAPATLKLTWTPRPLRSEQKPCI